MKRHVPALAALALSIQIAPVGAQEAAPLEETRGYTWVSDDLASAGQIAYDQIPLLAEEGYEVVVNLATAREEANGREGFLVTQQGLAYFHIPVDWQEPTLEDVQLFFDVMQAAGDRKVFVHCFANMRATAFVYMYRTLVLGDSEAEARGTMSEVWDPWELEQWGGLIERAKERYAG